MKKVGFISVIIVATAIALVYILIPGTIKIGESAIAGIKSGSALRALHDDAKWQQWFPGKTANGNFLYNDLRYKPGKKEYLSLEVSVVIGKKDYNSAINIIPINPDSSLLRWSMQFTASNNPFKRIKQYQTAKKIKINMALVLNSFENFIRQTKNIYGFKIQFTTLTDTALVSIKTNTKTYPSIKTIYSLIDELKEYIAEHNAEQHNFPMLNITQSKDSSYELMVGLPTNILLTGNDKILPKRMIMLKDKTLVTEVTGNNDKIKQALQATQNFMDDYELSSPVIPFQLLITDRRQFTDSTKWITKIFTPII